MEIVKQFVVWMKRFLVVVLAVLFIKVGLSSLLEAGQYHNSAERIGAAIFPLLLIAGAGYGLFKVVRGDS